jgi:serine/threonine protein phosphatase 1
MVDSTLAPGSLRQGLRVYAIGDVHGCLDRLVSLHWAINADLAAHPVAESVLIHLGDYVDRGTDSAGVVWLLTGSVAPPVSRRVDLMGNHEVMMVEALSGDNQRAAESWLDNGGASTLESYHVPVGAKVAEWQQAVPLGHRQWLKTRELMHLEDGYLFVHAGIRPGRALGRQRPEDLLWIREPFLHSAEKHPFVVVHGHTPRAEPDVHPNRIGIDTGAVMGGVLTCLVLEEDRMRFLTA